MPERLRIGGAGRGKHGMYLTRGGANPNNLIGGNVWDDIADGIGQATKFIPVVHDAYKTVRHLVGGAGEAKAYREALHADQDLFDNLNKSVDKAIKTITKLEKDDIIKAKDGSAIKHAIYTAQEQNLRRTHEALAPQYAGYEAGVAQIDAMFTGFMLLTPEARAERLESILAALGVANVAVPVGETSLQAFARRLHEQIVEAYLNQPTEADKQQFLYRLIHAGAYYTDSKGEQSKKALKLTADSDYHTASWDKLGEIARQEHLFIKPPFRTEYTKKIGKKNPKDVQFYQGADKKLYSAETGKVYTDRYAEQFGDDPLDNLVRTVHVPASVYAQGYDPRATLSIGRIAELTPAQRARLSAFAPPVALPVHGADDDDDAAQVGNGWGRY